jgi:hypothetical protein
VAGMSLMCGHRKKANEAVPVISHFGTVEVSTPRADTLERWIVLKYDMTALFTLVPVSARYGGHDFKMGTFDAVGATNYLERFWHEGRAGDSAQLRTISNTLFKLQPQAITRPEALYVRHHTNGWTGSRFRGRALWGEGLP